jgi:hypothetical protein
MHILVLIRNIVIIPYKYDKFQSIKIKLTFYYLYNRFKNYSNRFNCTSRRPWQECDWKKLAALVEIYNTARIALAIRLIKKLMHY